MNAKKLLAILLALATLISCVICFAACGKKDEPDTTEESTSAPEETTAAVPTNVNPLTGEADYDEKYQGQKFVGIVVENHPDARPQWGMSTPDVLMEYEVEGGISRMLWLYANQDRVPENVGPVRSARHDIVEIARGWDLLFVHCGGSPAALNRIKSYKGALAEIDGLTYSPCFYRSRARRVSQEHRLVLMGEEFRTSVKSLGLKTEIDEEKTHPFAFAPVGSPRALEGDEAQKIHFEYSNSYTYDFTYNAASGKYEAAINGTPRVDDQDVLCDYTNLVLLYVRMTPVGDKSGHQELHLEEGGEGLYLCGGKAEKITWQKGEDADPLRLLTADGAPLTLNPGKSYIGLVRSTQNGKTVIG